MKFTLFVAFLCLGGLASAHHGVVYDGLYKYGPAPIGHDGRVVDTPEVAYAKAAHISAFNSIASHNYAPLYSGVYQYGAAPLAADGRVLDTPEVAHAKAAHFAAYNAIAQHNYAGVYASGYHQYGPAPLAADGRVVDTPEVVHAKAAHFAAYNAALHANNDHGALVPVYASGYHQYGQAPLAADGRVIDTPEVAHAKSAHFAAHQEALHRTTAPIYGAGVYPVYGLAQVQLTHDGQYLQETPAVAHARAAHLAAYNAVASGVPTHAGYTTGSYVYAPAHVQLTHDGKYLQETPEVAYARAQHLAAYNVVASRAANVQYGSAYPYHQW